MAEIETENKPKDLIEPTPEELEKMEKENVKVSEKMISQAEDKEEKEVEEKIKKEVAEIEKKEEKKKTFAEIRLEREKKEQEEALASWVPKTQIGKDVKGGKEKNIDDILDDGKKILEPEIVDLLLSLENDLILIGQAKGKFGGGKRRAWRQTQKKTKEGNVLTFSAMAIVGDKNGHVGVGYGKAKETLPARKKSLRSAKLNLIKVKRACAHFDCSCGEKHTVPYIVEGKSGSVRIKLMPAPQGTGLVVGDEVKKILKLTGIKDVYGVSRGHVRTTFNLAKATIDALSKTTKLEI